MTIAQMSNDQATEAMVRISSAFSFICDDKDVVALLEELNESRNENLITAVPKYLPKFTTLAFRRHKDSLYEIVSAISGVDKKDVGAMNFKATVGIIAENWDDLRTFFPSSVTIADTIES